MNSLEALKAAVEEAVAEYRQQSDSDYRKAAAALIDLAADLVDRIDLADLYER